MEGEVSRDVVLDPILPEAQLPKECFAGDLDADLGNLTATHPADPPGVLNPETGRVNESELRSLAQNITQALLGQLLKLPPVSNPGGTVQLPAPATPLPRARHIPQPKPLTPWQKFAKEKGIVKKKRSKLVFDENEQTWKRRHGMGRANDALDVPIIEAGADDKVGEDPFTRLEQERKAHAKSSKQKLRAAKAGGVADSSNVPSTIKMSTKLSAHSQRGMIAKGKEMKQDIQAASTLAGVATASMGKFDRRLKGETGKRKLPGINKRSAMTGGGSDEAALMSAAAGKIARRTGGEGLNVTKAISHFKADAGDSSEPGQRRKHKAGRVKNRRTPKPKTPVGKKGGVMKRTAKKGGKRK